MLRYLVFSFGLCYFPVVSVLAQEDPFTRITEGAIATDTTASTGVIWGDIDNDDDLDVFVTSLDSGPNQLYRNDGGGRFVVIDGGDIAKDTKENEASWGATFGDYDNDGFLDLFVANQNRGAEDAGNNYLYRNNGDGTFKKVEVGDIVNDVGFSVGCSWGDYDNDGLLDLFVSNIGNNFLYHNLGNDTFERILEGEIVNDGGNSRGCAWADYDNDGYLDLFVCNLDEKNFLYRNKRDGTFERILTGEIVNDVSASWSCSWGDYDNDLDLDIFVATGGLSIAPNLFYENNGDGSFKRILEGDLISENVTSFGSSWGDFDNDGDQDLFVANIFESQSQRRDNSLFRNNGDRTFSKIISPVTTDGGFSVGSAWGDFNGDNQLDLFGTNGFLFGREVNFLYSNNGNQNHWINIKCVGTVSNRSAIGAKVKVKAAGQWQLNEISGQTGFGGQNSLNAEFGLGTATVIDSIKIEWSSGIKQVLTNISQVNRLLTIEEPSCSPAISSLNHTADVRYQTSASVSADLTTCSDLSTVLLLYREGGTVSFQTTTMTPSGESYTGDIPAKFAGTRGVEYKIVATDIAGRADSTDWRSISVRLPENVLSKTHEGGTTSNAYRFRTGTAGQQQHLGGGVHRQSLRKVRQGQAAHFRHRSGKAGLLQSVARIPAR